MNPLAQFQKEITLEKALSSQVVSWPLKLYDACPITDGSAAVILASEETARKLSDTPIWIKGIGLSSDSANLSKRGDYLGLRATVDASRKAYAAAKISPKDVDVATCHDCFTIAELMAYEDLGFCAKGEGGKLVREGQTEVGGKIPVNLDGGLKAKGHPVGATGVSMTVEISKQLRGEAESGQAGPDQERDRPRPQRGWHGPLLLRDGALEVEIVGKPRPASDAALEAKPEPEVQHPDIEDQPLLGPTSPKASSSPPSAPTAGRSASLRKPTVPVA